MIENPSRRSGLLREISAGPLEIPTLSRARIRVRGVAPREALRSVSGNFSERGP